MHEPKIKRLTLDQWRINRKLKDIKENPDNHYHSFDELQACCTLGGNRVFSIQLMDAHPKMIGPGGNGGATCDVTSGHCSCGAYHERAEDADKKS